MLAPARTGTGLAELVTDRSAKSATCTLTDAVLLPGFGSPVVDDTESVCVMVVPEATFVFTFRTRVKFAVVFAAIVVVSLQMRVNSTQVHPAGPVRDTAVVFAGRVAVKVTD